MHFAAHALCWNPDHTLGGKAMKIPREIQIPAVVLTLEAIFLVLVPN